MVDALLTVATLVGGLALLKGADTGARLWWIGSGAAPAAGVMAQGLVILVHIGPAILPAPLWTRQPRAVGWAETARAAGIARAAVLCILAFWLVPAMLAGGPDYRDAILWTPSAGCISGKQGH